MDASVVRIVRAVATAVATHGARLTHADDVLRLSNPKRPLERGYSITMREGETRPLRDAADVAPGQVLRTVLAKGRIRSTVEETVP
jgi:exonuclease VII large subunit